MAIKYTQARKPTKLPLSYEQQSEEVRRYWSGFDNKFLPNAVSSSMAKPRSLKFRGKENIPHWAAEEGKAHQGKATFVRFDEHFDKYSKGDVGNYKYAQQHIEDHKVTKATALKDIGTLYKNPQEIVEAKIDYGSPHRARLIGYSAFVPGSFEAGRGERLININPKIENKIPKKVIYSEYYSDDLTNNSRGDPTATKAIAAEETEYAKNYFGSGNAKKDICKHPGSIRMGKKCPFMHASELAKQTGSMEPVKQLFRDIIDKKLTDNNVRIDPVIIKRNKDIMKNGGKR